MRRPIPELQRYERDLENRERHGSREEGAERFLEPDTELTKAALARTCARVLASMKRVGSRFDSHVAPTEIGGSARSELGEGLAIGSTLSRWT